MSTLFVIFEYLKNHATSLVYAKFHLGCWSKKKPVVFNRPANLINNYFKLIQPTNHIFPLQFIHDLL